MSENKLQEELTSALKSREIPLIRDILNDKGFNVNWRDVGHELQSVLMKLCYLRVKDEIILELLDILFERDPDVNLQDSFGKTALMHACLAGRSDVTEYLISDPATRISIFDFDGNSVLVHAIRKADYKSVKRLLETPTGPSLLEIYNCNGKSPVDIAREEGDKKIIKLIESYQNNLLQMDSEKGRKSRGFLPPAEKARGNGKCHSDIDTPLQLIDLEKCTPRSTYIDSETPNLYLTSPKFRRRKKGQSIDCMKEKGLPAITTINKDHQNVKSENDKKKRQRSRKNSISLPDLRDSPGGLVTSGQNTPSCSYDYSSDSDFSDDVIIPPTFQSPRKKYDGVTVKRSVSEKQIGFPSIKGHNSEDGKVKRTLTDANVYHHSDEKIHKLKILQKSILS